VSLGRSGPGVRSGFLETPRTLFGGVFLASAQTASQFAVSRHAWVASGTAQRLWMSITGTSSGGNHGSGPCSSVRFGDWKLIHWIESDSVELFNLATDPSEKTDLAAQQGRMADSMRHYDVTLMNPRQLAPITRPA
jgi:hypothetical protein